MIYLTTEADERLLAWRASESQRSRYAQAHEDARRVLARRVEHDVIEHLRERGYFVSRTPHNAHFDLVVNGLRVEVKAATWSERTRRYQAALRGNEADALILGCENGRTHFFVIPFEQVQGLSTLAIWSVEPDLYAGRWRRWLEAWSVIDSLIARGVNHWQMPLWRQAG